MPAYSALVKAREKMIPESSGWSRDRQNKFLPVITVPFPHLRLITNLPGTYQVDKARDSHV